MMMMNMTKHYYFIKLGTIKTIYLHLQKYCSTYMYVHTHTYIQNNIIVIKPNINSKARVAKEMLSH